MAKGDLSFELDEKDYQSMMAILKGMDDVDKAKAIQYALKEGMQIIVSEGKHNLSSRNGVKTGNLKKSFAIKVNKKKAYSLGGFRRSSRKENIAGGNHSYLVDRGTDERWTKKGAYRGSVSRGNPKHGSMYWTDAVNSQGEHALNRLMDAIWEALEDIKNRKGQ